MIDFEWWALVCILGAIFLVACVLNVRKLAVWVGNRLADLLGGSPRW